MRYQSPQSLWSKLFSSRIFLSALVLLFVFIVYSIYQEKREQKVTDENIASLQGEIYVLENKSLELAQLIKYLRSDEFVEKEAREKLNMQKQDEQVVIVPEDDDELIGQVAGDMHQGLQANWTLWVEYFFEDTHK